MARSRYGYSPALDGLRGIFMLGFLLYHFGMTFLSGMWLAINFFFVLSGFLITRLLVEEHHEWGRISALDFYRRRARRLFPGLFALLAAVAAYGVWVAPAWQKKAIGNDLLATLGYVMNWRLVSEGDQYFFNRDLPSLLRHAWTLAVEEQYYILIPLLMTVVLAFVRTRRGRVGVFTGLALALTAWAAHVGFHDLADHPRAYYGTDMRGSAMLVGSALGIALALRRDGSTVELPMRRVQVLGWGGLAAMVASFLLISPYAAWMWNQGGLLLSSLASAAIVAACADRRPWALARIFGVRPLVWIGVHTYSLYLWHWPIALAGDLLLPGNRWLAGSLGFVLTCVVAALSYRFLERPVMYRGVRGHRGLRGHRGHRGLLPRTRMPLLWGAAPALIVAVVAVQVLRPNPSFADLGTAVPLPGGGMYDPVTEAHPKQLVAGQPAYVAGQPGRIGVYGDSVPHYLAQRFPRAAYPEVHLTSLTREGCDLLDLPMTLGEVRTVENEALCRDLKRTWPQQLATDRDEVLVVFASPLLAVPHLAPGGRTLWLDAPEIQSAIVGRWEQMRAQALAAGATQMQIVNVPCREPVPQAIPEEFRSLLAESGHIIAEYRDPTRINALVARFVAAHPDVRLVDLHAAQCGSGMQRVVNGIEVYNDFLHFSPQATPMIWSWLLGQISRNWAARVPG